MNGKRPADMQHLWFDKLTVNVNFRPLTLSWLESHERAQVVAKESLTMAT